MVTQSASKLDALLLGAAEAQTSGVNVAQLQHRAIFALAMLTAVAVSACGMIGFIGLVTPHISRQLVGASHRCVLPMSCVLGGVIMVVADLVSRTLIAPAELPIGIVTAMVGAPVFIALLIREGKRWQW